MEEDERREKKRVKVKPDAERLMKEREEAMKLQEARRLRRKTALRKLREAKRERKSE